jgi:hypothetical protein
MFLNGLLPKHRVPPSVGSTSATLPGRLCNGIHLQGDRSLSQRTASHNRAGLHGDQGLTQYNSIEPSRRSQGRLASDLPENVLGLGAAAQSNGSTVTHGEIARNLKDPDIVGTTMERDSSGDYDRTAPFVEAGTDCFPVNISRPQLRGIGQ